MWVAGQPFHRPLGYGSLCLQFTPVLVPPEQRCDGTPQATLKQLLSLEDGESSLAKIRICVSPCGSKSVRTELPAI